MLIVEGGQNKMNILFAQAATESKPLTGIIHKILTFIYFLAHQIGDWIVKGFQSIFPHSVFPNTIADPLGFLIILTLFMLLFSVAKKIAWIVLCAGWILLIIRIVMIIFKLG
jgi:hypothetical protein